jgi:hypothetical protein
MRRVTIIACLFVVCLAPAAFAQERGAIEGFGGFSVNGFQSGSFPSLGGTLSFDVVPGMQIVGEAGHIGNVAPSLASSIFDVARTDLQVSAFSGEGGVRFLAPSGVVAPYAEATAGIARLNVSSPVLGVIGNAATTLALGFAGRTTPIASVGGGVLLRGGPLVFDVGYRYKRLFANEVLEAALGFGEPLHSHEVRAGVGVRF